MSNTSQVSKILEVKTTIEAEVNAISDLTTEQKAKVIDIAIAHAANHAYQIPSITGIANLVRSRQ